MSDSWSGGSTRAWRRTRKRVLIRDQYRCQLKIEGTCTTIADCVHHLRGKKHGDNEEWLVASCTPCNLKTGDPEATAKDPDVRPRTRW